MPVAHPVASIGSPCEPFLNAVCGLLPLRFPQGRLSVPIQANFDISIRLPICYLRRLIFSTHTMQAPLGAEDECFDASCYSD
jgi:hypothetical protein